MTDAPSKPRRPVSFFIFAALVLTTLVAVAFSFVIQQQRVDALSTALASKNQIINDKDAQLSSLLDKYAALADDCEQAADCTTTTPSVEVIERTLTIEGTPGTQGPAGPGASDSQVADQVRSYCGARDDCRGPKGDTGAAGTDGRAGADSTTSGPKGDTGAPGADGRSVTDNQCIGEGDTSYWQTTYSDGTTTTSPGPCRLTTGIDILG